MEQCLCIRPVLRKTLLELKGKTERAQPCKNAVRCSIIQARSLSINFRYILFHMFLNH